MKRLLLFALIAFAAWYGWRNYDKVFHRGPSHDAVIINHSGRGMSRVRLTVGGQTLVSESIGDESRATFQFKVNDDSDLGLTWQWTGTEAEKRWRGGMVPKGPMVQKHLITIDGDGGVIYQAENKLGS